MRYTVRYEKDESGAWNVAVKELPGVFTYGRTLKEARSRVREALAVWLDDWEAAKAAELVDDIRLPAEAKRALKAARDGRKKAAELQARVAEATRVAVEQLAAAGLSLQDAGELVGLTRQRVHQLAAAASASPEPPAARRKG